MNILGCSTVNLNTGVPNCSYDFGEIKKIMLIPKGKSFTQTEIQTMYTTLSALAKNADESLRGYPIGLFTGIEDKTEEVSLVTNQYGGINLGRSPKPHYVFTFQNGGMTYDINLNTFRDKQDSFDVLVFDTTNNTAVGTKPDLNTSFYVLKGFSTEQIYNPTFKLTGEAITEHKLGICFSDLTEFTTNLAVYKLPSTQRVNNINGLRNFEMSVLPATGAIAAAGTALKLRITTDGGSIDLGSLYSASWAALDTQFTVVGSNGTSYAITSGAYTAATGSVDFVIATLPSAGVDLTITSPTITQLEAQGVVGFANGTLVATVLSS